MHARICVCACARVLCPHRSVRYLLESTKHVVNPVSGTSHTASPSCSAIVYSTHRSSTVCSALSLQVQTKVKLHSNTHAHTQKRTQTDSPARIATAHPADSTQKPFLVSSAQRNTRSEKIRQHSTTSARTHTETRTKDVSADRGVCFQSQNKFVLCTTKLPASTQPTSAINNPANQTPRSCARTHSYTQD